MTSFNERRGFLRRAAAATGLLLSGGLLYHGQLKKSTVIKSKNPESKEGRENMELLIISKVFGMRPEEIKDLKKYYDIAVPVNVGLDSNYCVHIGQTHSSERTQREGNDSEASQKTIQSQYKIYEFLRLMTQKIGLKKIYSEGHTVFDNVKKDNRNFVVKELQRLRDIKRGITDDNKTQKSWELLYFAEIFDANDPEKIEAWNLLGQAFLDVCRAIGPNVTPELDSTLDFIVSKWGYPNLFAYSGVFALYLEKGELIMIPSELRTLNKEGIAATKEDEDLLQIWLWLRSLPPTVRNHPRILDEVSKKLRELGKDEAQAKSAMDTLTEKIILHRERFAVAQLPNDENSFLVYGQDHDFSKIISERNSNGPTSNSDAKLNPLGLINIYPKG